MSSRKNLLEGKQSEVDQEKYCPLHLIEVGVSAMKEQMKH